MWHSLFTDARFHESLLELDRQSAAQAKADGCPVCGGVLHSAAFPRKPRGGPQLSGEHEKRFSFCCACELCRRRLTPPSLRFLGRRVYVAAVVVVVALLRHGPNRTRVRCLEELLGVSRRTVERWCKWWCSEFTKTEFWRAACGRFAEPVAATELPLSLLQRFGGGYQEQLIGLLGFLGPISGGVNRQGF